MPKLMLLILLLLSPFLTVAQSQPCNNYACKMELARKALRTGNYKSALDLARGAENYDPSKKAEVNAFIDEVFGAIEGKREESERLRKRAEDSENEAKLMRVLAEQSLKKAEREAENTNVERNKLTVAVQIAEKQTRAAKNAALSSQINKYDHTLAMRMMQYNYLKHNDEYTQTIYFENMKDSLYGLAVEVVQLDTYAINKIAVSPDGKKVLIARSNKTVILWDIADRIIEKSFSGHQEGIRSVVFSPDGKRILTGGDDGLAILWDVETAKPEYSFGDSPYSITSVAFSPDGGKILTGSVNSETVLWDISSRKIERKFLGTNSFIQSVAISSDGNKVLTGNYHGDIVVWNVATGKSIVCYSGQGATIDKVSFCREGKKAFAANGNGIIILDIDNPSNSKIIEERTTCFAISPDESKIIIGGISCAKQIDIESQKVEKVYCGHIGLVHDVAFSPNGNLVLTAGSEMSLKMWDNRQRIAETYFDGAIHDFDLSNDKKQLLLCNEKKIFILDISNWASEKEIISYSGGINAVRFSPDGQKIIIGTDRCHTDLWDIENRKKLKTFAHYQDCNAIYEMDFSPDGEKVVTRDRSKIFLWETENHKENIHPLYQFRGYTFSFSPDSRRLLISGDDGTLLLWDINEQREYKTSDGYNNYTYALCFSPDGMHFLSVGSDKFIRLWDSQTMTLVSLIESPFANLYCVKFSSDGRKILCAGEDGIAMIWDIRTKKLEKTFTGFDSPILKADFINDDEKIIINDKSGNAILFNINADCLECQIFTFSLSELRAAGLQLEPEDLLTLWEQGEQLTTDELHLIAKNSNKTKH